MSANPRDIQNPQESRAQAEGREPASLDRPADRQPQAEAPAVPDQVRRRNRGGRQKKRREMRSGPIGSSELSSAQEQHHDERERPLEARQEQQGAAGSETPAVARARRLPRVDRYPRAPSDQEKQKEEAALHT